MAKKKRVYVKPEKDTTTPLFTTLMLILLTFFIVLSTLGVQDARRQRMAMNSLLGSFGILAGGQSPYKPTAGGRDILPQSAPLTPSSMDVAKIRAALRKSGTLSGMGVSDGKLGATITFKGNLLFEDGAATLKPESRALLDALGEVLVSLENHLIITGHTDSVPCEDPPYESNWGLSSARALTVLQQMNRRGVADERMAAYGMGSQRPLSSNDTEYGRRLNQRVEITIVGGLPGRMSVDDLPQSRPEPVRTFQYNGFRFRLEEQ